MPRDLERRFVGQSLTDASGLGKVTGRANYSMDLQLPGMLYAKVKRSPHPHARVLKVDATKAAKLEGVRAIITPKNIPNVRFGAVVLDEQVLAFERVRYVGEPVAAVAAHSLEIAEEALELIDVEYELLPPIFDPESGLSVEKDRALHPEFEKYSVPADIRLGSIGHDPKLPNVTAHFKVRKGDLQNGFRKADEIIENRFTTQMAQQVPMEPYICLCNPDPDGSVTVYTSTQAPMAVRRLLSQAIAVGSEKIRVITPYVGGGFGCKLEVKAEPICALLAQRARAPVRLQFTREETFANSNVRHPFTVYIKDGVMKDGRVVARQVRLILDGGAYAGLGISVTKSSIYGASEVYLVPNFELDSYRVYTNKPPASAYRGFGCAQVEWATESQMNVIAKQLGIDPIEIRRINMLRPGDVTVIGEVVEKPLAGECMNRVLTEIEWDKPKQHSIGSWKIGRGLAIGAKYSKAPTYACAVVKVWPEGIIEVKTGATDIGGGTYTVLAQMAAEEFQIPISKIKITSGDTDIAPFDEGAYSSRQTFNSGKAVVMACKEAKKDLFERAARLLDATPEQLETSDGLIMVTGTSKPPIPIQQVFADSRNAGYFLYEGGEISGKATSRSEMSGLDPETGQVKGDRANSFYMYIATAVQLAVNVETGQVKIQKLVTASDNGKAINPTMVHGQLEGCTATGISTALYEELVVDKGVVLNPSFMDYKVPSSLESLSSNSLKTILLDIPYEDGPFGAKGGGEVGMMTPTPAIVDAISDAIGIRIKNLPATSERVLSELTKTQ